MGAVFHSSNLTSLTNVNVRENFLARMQIRIQRTGASGLKCVHFPFYSKCNRPLIAATASSEVTQEHEGSQHRQGGGACSGSKQCG